MPTSRKVVVLTFDGGGNAAGLASILATLEAEKVPGTFFLTGRWVQVYPREAQAIADAGHVIGNHTMTHLHSTAVPDSVLLKEIRDAALTIRAATGVDPRPWFRFPYGERTEADVRLVNAHGYVCVSWGLDTLGWLGSSRGTAADVTRRVVAALQPGLIVLMHVGANPDDGTTYDADSLAATIAALRARGYTFATVTALLDRPQR
ncbi:polysaccharide deacetylase family protein [Longivirga aurantiaca]|uniref:Polysaccharide deacetylase family protein n=1 Tax=Longivirga aurantiaca TaxID=1837743 RepID=A0ABW1T2A3_9ACTN